MTAQTRTAPSDQTANHPDHDGLRAMHLDHLAVELARAEHRARRAAWYGDHAGALIAQGDARRIARRLSADAAYQTARELIASAAR